MNDAPHDALNGPWINGNPSLSAPSAMPTRTISRADASRNEPDDEVMEWTAITGRVPMLEERPVFEYQDSRARENEKTEGSSTIYRAWNGARKATPEATA
jgi:hypothetical protein